MKTVWRKNQENSSDRISHAWAPLRNKPEVQYVHRYRQSETHTKTGRKTYRRQRNVHVVFVCLHIALSSVQVRISRKTKTMSKETGWLSKRLAGLHSDGLDRP